MTEEKIKNKISKEVLVGWSILIVVAVITSLLGIYISKNFEDKSNIEDFKKEVIKKTTELEKKSEEIEELVKPKKSEFPDYYNLKGKNLNKNVKQLLITNDCPEGGCGNDNTATKEFDGIEKKYKVTGKFTRAYLYIDAMVDYNRPLSIWDDVYFNIYWQGGHLIPDGNILPVPASDSSVYLYDMRSVSYYPKIKDKELKINKVTNRNLFNILKDGRIMKIHTSLSSDRSGRVLKEVSIYYECVLDSDCSIEEINNNN